MSRDDARREVRRAVRAMGTIAAFAKRAKVDPGTLGDFLSGERWASSMTQTKIEKALGWPIGRIADLEEGVRVLPIEGGRLILPASEYEGLTQQQAEALDAAMLAVAERMKEGFLAPPTGT